MRAKTKTIHARAERTGIVAALLTGQVSRRNYALYLRNLLPAYQAMEQALKECGGLPSMAGLAQPLLYRSAHITADLDMLVGSNWLAALPLLPSGEAYATRVAWAAGGDGAMLIAHAYTRYLGDLNGGQILGRRLLRQFGPDFRATAFTEFPAIDDIRAFAAAYRAALNHAGAQLPDAEGVVQEAELAFEMNIQLSHDVDMRR